MAKKTKRKVSTGTGLRTTAGVSTAGTGARSFETDAPEGIVEAAPRGAQAPTFRRTTSYTTEFNPDYSYVVKDLKRIGVLAGTFFTILIVLSFFIR